MAINLNVYKYFFAVMEAGNICRAAEKLGVSQPTVTYNIQELEKDLRTKLFVVGRHGVEPQAVAVAFYRRVRPHYQAILDAVAEFTPSG